MADDIRSITRAKDEISKLENRLDRQRSAAAEQKDNITTIATALGSRVATRLLPSLFPAMAGIMPIITMGGAAFSLMQVLDGSSKNNAAFLGAGIGLGMDAADKIADFALNTVSKFQSK